MPTIPAMREALATRLATIPGLRASSYVPDQVNPPVAVVFGPSEVDYDKTFGRGHDDYRFTIVLLTSRVSDRSGQAQLDSFIAPYGDTSVKHAVEGDGGNLGGLVDSCVATDVRDYGSYEVNDVLYYSAAVTVAIMASGKE